MMEIYPSRLDGTPGLAAYGFVADDAMREMYFSLTLRIS